MYRNIILVPKYNPLIVFIVRHNIEKLILEAINYISKISKKKVTVDSISSYITNNGAHNIDCNSITETLKQMQDNGLINKLYRPIEKSQITPDTHQSTPSRSKTPPASENHRNTINDSINRSILSFHRLIGLCQQLRSLNQIPLRVYCHWKILP